MNHAYVQELSNELQKWVRAKAQKNYRVLEQKPSVEIILAHQKELQDLGYLPGQNSSEDSVHEYSLWGAGGSFELPPQTSWYLEMLAQLAWASGDLALLAHQKALSLWFCRMHKLNWTDIPYVCRNHSTSTLYYLGETKPKQIFVFDLNAQPWLLASPHVKQLTKQSGLDALSLYQISIPKVIKQIPVTREAILGLFSRELLALLSIEWGLLQWAEASTRLYAAKRYQGGKLLQEHEAIQNMFFSLQKANLTYQIFLQSSFSQKPLLSFWKELTIQRRHLSDLAKEASWAAMQIHGGYGYMQDYGMEMVFRYIRFLRQWPIGLQSFIPQETA